MKLSNFSMPTVNKQNGKVKGKFVPVLN